MIKEHASPRVQGGYRIHIFGAEFKIEHAEILHDSFLAIRCRVAWKFGYHRKLKR